MPKEQEPAAKDSYEEEYGPMQAIYINESAYKQLDGDESYGKWYDACRYVTSPTAEFCIKTVVPRSSLEDGLFLPDHFEPDIAAERCERVSSADIAHQTKETKPKLKFRKGMKVTKTFYGLDGYTETNEDVIESVKKGVVRTEECENGITFDAKTGKELENFFPGMHQEIVPLELPKSTKSKKSKKSK